MSPLLQVSLVLSGVVLVIIAGAVMGKFETYLGKLPDHDLPDEKDEGDV